MNWGRLDARNENAQLPKMDVLDSVRLVRFETQSLTAQPDISFPNQLRSAPAGRKRQSEPVERVCTDSGRRRYAQPDAWQDQNNRDVVSSDSVRLEASVLSTEPD